MLIMIVRDHLQRQHWQTPQFRQYPRCHHIKNIHIHRSERNFTTIDIDAFNCFLVKWQIQMNRMIVIVVGTRRRPLSELVNSLIDMCTTVHVHHYPRKFSFHSVQNVNYSLRVRKLNILVVCCNPVRLTWRIPKRVAHRALSGCTNTNGYWQRLT
jgi:hypothetical protein